MNGETSVASGEVLEIQSRQNRSKAINCALSRLTAVSLRDVWPSECNSFTPWLAKEENLELLGEAIGIDLELEAQEKEVGLFRADILCKDTLNGNWVLIENQIERTDHGHLGQLLTYAAGLQAVTIVWIAREFTEEHRATLDWLNEITDERFNFFGLEIELWRIADSPVAPKFNIVCKPNDWSKTVHEGARNLASEEITDTKRLQLEYWTAFRKDMEDNHSFIRSQKPLAQHWANHAIGRANFNLVATVNTRENCIGTSVVLMGAEAKPRFKVLLQEKLAFQSQLEELLEWEELPGRKESRVTLKMHDADPTDRSDWPRQHEWLRKSLECLHRTFSPRIKSLEVSDA